VSVKARKLKFRSYNNYYKFINPKLKKIEELNKSLNNPEELAGMFLPKGCKERFDIMFVAEMPSMNELKDDLAKDNFNFGVTARDRFFQEMLIKYDVAGSYMTDIVKARDIPRQPTEKEIKKWLNFLLEEIKIISPKVIIVVGQRTYEQSFRPFVEPLLSKNIKIDYIFHYCSQVPRDKFEERFKEIIGKLKE